MKQLYVKCIDSGIYSGGITEGENYPIIDEDDRSDTYEIRDNSGQVFTYFRWRFSEPFEVTKKLYIRCIENCIINNIKAGNDYVLVKLSDDEPFIVIELETGAHTCYHKKYFSSEPFELEPESNKESFTIEDMENCWQEAYSEGAADTEGSEKCMGFKYFIKKLINGK